MSGVREAPRARAVQGRKHRVTRPPPLPLPRLPPRLLPHHLPRPLRPRLPHPPETRRKIEDTNLEM